MHRYIFVSLFILLFSIQAHAKSIVDTEGRVVKVPDRVKRAVVLTGTCIETIYILGEIEKVEGISRSMLDNPFYSEIIRELRKIPVVAQDLRNIDLEKIIALRPDIIISIGPEHPYGMSKELVRRLESYGIPLVLLNLESLEENYYSISLLGEIFNRQHRAQELIEYMKKIEKEITEKVRKIPKPKRVKALMLSQKPTMILGGYWKDQDIILMAGGINVANSVKDFVTEVSLEKIISWNPDAITIVGTAPYEPSWILNNHQWKDISAVKKSRVYKYPYQLTGLFTPRVVLLLAWHASKFYPELKIDWTKIADDFFKKFYGIPYCGPKN